MPNSWRGGAEVDGEASNKEMSDSNEGGELMVERDVEERGLNCALGVGTCSTSF